VKRIGHKEGKIWCERGPSTWYWCYLHN